MILYSNLSQVYENTNTLTPRPVLKLTSLKIKGNITSTSSQETIAAFHKLNKISRSTQLFIMQLLNEAIENNFSIQILGQ